MEEGQGISVLIDVNERVAGVAFSAPVYTYQNFRRQEGLTVEESLHEAGHDDSTGSGIQITIPWSTTACGCAARYACWRTIPR